MIPVTSLYLDECTQINTSLELEVSCIWNWIQTAMFRIHSQFGPHQIAIWRELSKQRTSHGLGYMQSCGGSSIIKMWMVETSCPTDLALNNMNWKTGSLIIPVSSTLKFRSQVRWEEQMTMVCLILRGIGPNHLPDSLFFTMMTSRDSCVPLEKNDKAKTINKSQNKLQSTNPDTIKWSLPLPHPVLNVEPISD